VLIGLALRHSTIRYSHRLNPSQRQTLACTMPHQVYGGG
jgi:hypothetical protein